MQLCQASLRKNLTALYYFFFILFFGLLGKSCAHHPAKIELYVYAMSLCQVILLIYSCAKDSSSVQTLRAGGGM